MHAHARLPGTLKSRILSKNHYPFHHGRKHQTSVYRTKIRKCIYTRFFRLMYGCVYFAAWWCSCTRHWWESYRKFLELLVLLLQTFNLSRKQLGHTRSLRQGVYVWESVRVCVLCVFVCIVCVCVCLCVCVCCVCVFLFFLCGNACVCVWECVCVQAGVYAGGDILWNMLCMHFVYGMSLLCHYHIRCIWLLLGRQCLVLCVAHLAIKSLQQFRLFLREFILVVDFGCALLHNTCWWFRSRRTTFSMHRFDRIGCTRAVVRRANPFSMLGIDVGPLHTFHVQIKPCRRDIRALPPAGASCWVQKAFGNCIFGRECGRLEQACILVSCIFACRLEFFEALPKETLQNYCVHKNMPRWCGQTCTSQPTIKSCMQGCECNVVKALQSFCQSKNACFWQMGDCNKREIFWYMNMTTAVH